MARNPSLPWRRAAGAVVLMASGRVEGARVEAERLAARIGLASEESVIANRPLALVVSDEGAGFERFDDGRWAPIEHGAPLAFRPWPAGMEAAIVRSAFEVEENRGRVTRFDVLGGADAAELVLSQNGARWRVRISEGGQADVARAE